MIVTGAIILLIVLVYARSLMNGFVEWDDGLLIQNNSIIRGPTPLHLWQAFTTFDPELYIPLTFISYQLNYVVGGLAPFGYHLVNLLLHIGCTFLILLIGERITGSRAAGVIAALLFAVHPLNTEAVAWASARKDVLSAFFTLLSVYLWLQWQRTERRTSYWWSVVTYALALLAKVNVLVLPMVLLLIPLAEGKRPDRETLKATAPYFALSVLLGIVALVGKAGRNTGFLWEKVLIGAKAAVFYLSRIAWPFELSALYPYTHTISLQNPDILVALLICIALTIVALIFHRRWPWFLVVWCSYLLFLAPSFTNFAKGWDQMRDVYIGSDRYAYIAMIPVFLLLGAFIGKVLQRWKLPTVAVLTVLILFLGFHAQAQSLTWHNTESLFRNVIAHYPDSHIAYGNLGAIVYQQGKGEEALQYFQKSLEIRPNSIAFFNLGYIAMEHGLDAKAEELFRKAIEQRPWDSEALTKLGVLLLKRGAVDEALTMLERAAMGRGPTAETFENLATAYERLGRLEDAIRARELLR